MEFIQFVHLKCWCSGYAQKRICFLIWLISDANRPVINNNQWFKWRQNANISHSTSKECIVWLWTMFHIFNKVTWKHLWKTTHFESIFLSRTNLQLCRLNTLQTKLSQMHVYSDVLLNHSNTHHTSCRMLHCVQLLVVYGEYIRF